MELHAIKIYQTEFSLLHMNFKSEILVEPDVIFNLGDIVHLIEITEGSERQTGRTLNYRIKGFNKEVKLKGGLNCWTVYLKRLVNYEERMKMLIKENEGSE